MHGVIRCQGAVFISGQSQQQVPLDRQSHVHVHKPLIPDPDIHFFNHAVAPQRARKPVQWFRPGQDRNPGPPKEQATRPAADKDPWLLGEHPATKKQAPAQPRKRLSWAHKPAGQFAASQNGAQPMNGAGRPPNKRESRQQQEAARRERMALAAAAPPEQYLRHQAQVAKQVAQHAMMAQTAQQRKEERAQMPAAPSTYAALDAPSKRKPAPLPPIVDEAPKDVVIPPDVTVRQLAQLLGEVQTLC